MATSNVKNQKLEPIQLLQKDDLQAEDQSMGPRVAENFLRSELKELLAVIIFAFLGTALMMYLNAFEKLFMFSRPLEHFQFDEIAAFLPSFLAIGFVLFSYRRIQKLESEVIKRLEVERKLLMSEEEYKNLSITDDLTRLYNARHFFRKLKEEINRMMRYKQPMSLLLIDIDDFKKVNDQYGHLTGDKVLKIAGGIIAAFLRKTDTPYRYGGEEFAVLLPGTGIEAAMNVAERIGKGFEAQDFSFITNETLTITVSMGASQFKPGKEMEALV
ncbi:MAG: GGDEF domain-containing protein [Desulfobacterales bacterium]|nr:GGDEF domain-containing protein [Desulfobacterales bacterium]